MSSWFFKIALVPIRLQMYSLYRRRKTRVEKAISFFVLSWTDRKKWWKLFRLIEKHIHFVSLLLGIHFKLQRRYIVVCVTCVQFVCVSRACFIWSTLQIRNLYSYFYQLVTKENNTEGHNAHVFVKTIFRLTFSLSNVTVVYKIIQVIK